MEKVDYVLNSAFLTVQGEGYHAGRPAVFLRFVGCNIWSGIEKDRFRDSELNAKCAAHCDTDFARPNGKLGGTYTAMDLAELVLSLWKTPFRSPYVVLTGGEPGLQVTSKLVATLRKVANAEIAIETNGTILLPDNLDWVTLSPKPPMKIISQPFNEVKVLYPLFDPTQFAHHAPRKYIQPLDITKDYCFSDPSTRQQMVYQSCLDFVTTNADWRISIQSHKMLGFM